MPKTKKSTMPADYHKRHRVDYLEHLKKTGQPIVLSINGQTEIRIDDEESYERLLDLMDRLETIEGVRRGLESFEKGQGRPALEALEEIRKKHDPSR